MTRGDPDAQELSERINAMEDRIESLFGYTAHRAQRRRRDLLMTLPARDGQLVCHFLKRALPGFTGPEWLDQDLEELVQSRWSVLRWKILAELHQTENRHDGGEREISRKHISQYSIP